MPGEVDHREKEVTKLVGRRLAIAGHLPEFGQFFLDLGKHLRRLRPVEAHCGGPTLDLVRPCHPGQHQRDVVHQRVSTFFDTLDLFPVADNLTGIGDHDVTEHVWMPFDDLPPYAFCDFVEVEGAGFSRHGRVEHDLDQQIAKLLFQFGIRTEIGLTVRRRRRELGDGVDGLIGLLDQMADQGVVRLLSIPRALQTEDPVGCH